MSVLIMVSPAGTRVSVPESLAGNLTRMGWAVESTQAVNVVEQPSEAVPEDELTVAAGRDPSTEEAAAVARTPSLRDGKGVWAAYAASLGHTVDDSLTKREIIELVG